MSDTERPYVSTATSTRTQFLDAINSYLENNSISHVGPFRIETQETGDAGIHISKSLLSLKCEVQYVDPSSESEAHSQQVILEQPTNAREAERKTTCRLIGMPFSISTSRYWIPRSNQTQFVN